MSAIVHDRYRTSLIPSEYDSQLGSLRLINGLLARMGTPNSIDPDIVEIGPEASTLSDGKTTRLVGTNITGTAITFERVGTGVPFVFPAGEAFDLPCLKNSSEWTVKRTDGVDDLVSLPFLRYTMV